MILSRLLLIVSLILIISVSSLAQSLSGTLTLNPYPSPYVSDWENNPSALGSLIINNNSGRALQVRIRAVVSMQGRGEIFRSITNPIDISAAPVQIINNTTLISLSDASFNDKDYEKKMRQSGRLLEGYYTACLTLENTFGTILATNICSNFTILYPSAPQLIFPVNNDSIDVNTNYPTFQWTPVIVPPAYQIKYTLRIVEILQGQTVSQAITANIPRYENNQILINSFTYPIEALPLEEGKKYAWQIQSLDQFGIPPTQNEGRSEIFTFVKKKGSTYQFVQNPLTLKNPANDEFIKTNMPEFSWDFTPPFGMNTKYNIRVVKILPGQSLETAINNYPILNQIVLSKSYQPAQALPLNATDSYAWQVIAFNSQTNDTLKKSEIRKFKLFNLVLLLPSNNSVVNNKRPTFQWAYYGANKKFYDLKVIKLPMFYYSPDGSISESLFDDQNNVVYQKYNIDGAALSNVNSPGLEIPVFKPDADIPMEEAKSYYWQVSVKDQPFSNINAKSEIRKIVFNPYQLGFATNCNVSGNLFYGFADPGEYVMWALKNINVKFVVKYILKYTSYNSWGGSYQNNSSPNGEIEVPVTSLSPSYQNDYNKTIAIGKTDSDGNFSFSFMNLKPMGVINENFTLDYRPGQEFGYSYNGKLYRVIRLIVQSPYYTSPNTDIILQPGESKNFSQLIANARSYQLTINVKNPGSYWNNQFLSGNTNLNKMIVYLLRKTRPNEVPGNDGFPRPNNPNDKPLQNFEVVGRQISDQYGNATFKRLVKNVYSQNDEYWIWATVDSNHTSLLYRMWLPVKYKFKYSNDKAVYNNDYKYIGKTKNVVAFPLNPLIKGKIKRQDGGQPIQNAQVKLLKKDGFWWQKESNTLTNGSGKFWFKNLKNVFDGNGNPTGPVRRLKISKYGFRDATFSVKSGAILKPGESWKTEVLLQPDSKIKGKIVDENGNGISADVTVEGGETVSAIAPFILSMPGFKIVPASFEIRAPKGIVKIKFDPTQYNPSYLLKDTTIYVSGNVKDLGTIVIRKALHRIKIFAGDASKASGEFYYITSKLADAKVRLETDDGKLIGEKLTGISGFAEFVFANSSIFYKITVSAPNGQDFETKQISIDNKESGSWSFCDALLKPASHISGYVYVGTENQTVEDAHVWLNYSSSGLTVETYSDQSGYYELRNVPLGSNTVKASKKSSNLIGDQKNINVTQSGLENVNFNLKVYSDMDITHLMNFPIEVDNLTEQNGEVKISGSFVDLNQLKNNYFESNDPELQFTDVTIEPYPTLTSVIFGKTVPVAKPKTLPLKTDDNELSLNIFHNFYGSLIDKNIGVELVSDQTGTGVIKGKVFVSKSSFSISSKNLSFTGNGFYLKSPNVNDLRLPVITPDKSDPLSTNYFNTANENGGDVKYSVYGYVSDAELLNSFLYKDSVVLNTTIHTDITGMTPSDLNLKLGKITITLNKIKPLYNQTNKISYALGQWNVDLTKWSFMGYLSASEGTLKTNTVDIPVTSLLIKPTELSSAVFNFSSMSLGGVVPLNIIGTSMFGYENVSKNWYLTVDKGTNAYAASFSGLPGMEQNDEIHIASFSLYSDGIKNFSPQSNKIKIYKVASLTPDQVITGDNLVEITSLTFNIPKVGQLGAAIQYYKENNKIKFRLLPVKIVFSVNDVNLAFAEDAITYPEILDANGLRVRGRIYEDGKYDLKAWLYHTVDSTSIWVETPSSPFANNPPWQSINVGSATNYLDKIAGGMEVINNNTLWDTLKIAGDLITPSGIKKGKNRLSFTVTGDWIANGQELGISNISTPFGDMAWTYDFDESKLRGTMNLNQDIGGVTLVGPIETVVDGTGWYFFGAIKMKIPGIPEAGAAMIIGDYPSMPQTVKDGFTSVSYNKNLPCYFQNQMKGFLFSGHAAIPVVIPSIDIDAVIASIHFGVEAGADVRIWSGFDGNGSEYGLGVLAYLHAYFKMDAFTCTELSADAKLELGFEGKYQSNSGTFTLIGCGGFSVSGTLKQKGVGIGDLCTPPVITVFDESIGMHANIKLNSSGDISLGFGKGACSAANSTPCN